MLQIQPVAVELGDAAGSDNDTELVAAKLEDIERGEQGPAEGERHAVVGGRGEGEKVDAGSRERGHDGAARVRRAGDGGNGNRKQCLCHDCGGCDHSMVRRQTGGTQEGEG